MEDGFRGRFPVVWFPADSRHERSEERAESRSHPGDEGKGPEGDRDCGPFLRQLVGPHGGLPTLKDDLVRLAHLMKVDVEPKDTVPMLQQKIPQTSCPDDGEVALLRLWRSPWLQGQSLLHEHLQAWRPHPRDLHGHGVVAGEGLPGDSTEGAVCRAGSASHGHDEPSDATCDVSSAGAHLCDSAGRGRRCGHVSSEDELDVFMCMVPNGSSLA